MSNQTKPTGCRYCGAPITNNKKGRKRVYCDQNCRQKAYEQRHGLSSWSERQPRVESESDLVEAMSERAAEREAWSSTGRVASRATAPGRDLQLAVHAVQSSLWAMSAVLNYAEALLSPAVRPTHYAGPELSNALLNAGPLGANREGRAFADAAASVAATVLEEARRVMDPLDFHWMVGCHAPLITDVEPPPEDS